MAAPRKDDHRGLPLAYDTPERERTETDLAPFPEAPPRVEQHHRAFIIIMVVGAAMLLATIVIPVWKDLFVAAVVAAAVYGVYRPLNQRLGGRRHLAAALVTLATVILVLIPLAGLVLSGIGQVNDAVSWVRSIFATEGPMGFVERLPTWLAPIGEVVVRNVPADLDQVASRLLEDGLAPLAAGLSSITGMLFDFGLMVVALFFFLADGRRLMRWLSAHVPLSRNEQSEFIGAMRAMSTSLLRANLGTGAVQAAVALVGFLIVGVPGPVFFAIMTLVASFIPAVGTALVTLPLALGFLIAGRLWQGFVLLAWVALVATVDNLLRPYLARGRLKIHGGVVFFSFIGGIAAAGAIGLLLGPISVALFVTTLRIWKRNVTSA